MQIMDAHISPISGQVQFPWVTAMQLPEEMVIDPMQLRHAAARDAECAVAPQLASMHAEA